MRDRTISDEDFQKAMEMIGDALVADWEATMAQEEELELQAMLEQEDEDGISLSPRLREALEAVLEEMIQDLELPEKYTITCSICEYLFDKFHTESWYSSVFVEFTELHIPLSNLAEQIGVEARRTGSDDLWFRGGLPSRIKVLQALLGKDGARAE